MTTIQQEVEKVVEILKDGGVVIYPTDTLWGIGCDATNPVAVEKIYKLKQSENKKSMLVLVRDIPNVARYTTDVHQIAWDLMELTEKPLTLILPGAVGVAANLIPEERSLGVRVPKHEFCELLLRKLNRPIVSTSVNITGDVAAIKFEDINPLLKKQVDYVVEKRFEGKPTFAGSSIISIDSSSAIKVIRE